MYFSNKNGRTSKRKNQSSRYSFIPSIERIEHNVRTIDHLLAQTLNPQKKEIKKKVIKRCPKASNDVQIGEQTYGHKK
jgi:hypothetical protein